MAPSIQTVAQNHKLSPQGYQLLMHQLQVLKDRQRPTLLERIGASRATTTLRNIGSYLTAQEAMDLLDYRIRQLEELIDHAEIWGQPTQDCVCLGSRVTVKVNGCSIDYHMVGTWEANPKEYKISDQSPLGNALMGRQVGETVKVDAPMGGQQYQILSISL